MRLLAAARSSGGTASKDQPELWKNILWLIFSRFGAQGLAVLFTLLLARRLGSAAFGAYAFIAAVVFIGNALTTFGTDMLLIREIASRNDLSQLLPALLIQLVLSGGFIGVAWVAAPALPNQSPATILGLQIYSLALLPLAFFSVFTTALRGKQRMDAYMVLNLAVAVLQVAGVWALIRSGSSIPRLAGLLLSVQCAGALLGGIVCTLQIPGFWAGWRFSLRETAALVRASAPIALIALIGILYQKLSIYLVSTQVGPAPTGWFSAGLRVLEASKTVHMAIFTAIYPAMARTALTQAANFPGSGEPAAQTKWPWQGSFKGWNLLLAGAAAASLGIFFLSGPVVAILYGPDYAPSAAGLRILAWILIPFTVNTFFSLARLADHREQTVMRIQFIGLVALAGLSAWWIPRWNISGASLAFVLAETLQTLLYLLDLSVGNRFLQKPYRFRKLGFRGNGSRDSE